MKKALSLVVAALLAVLAPSAVLNAAPLTAAVAAGTLKVTVHYTGKGKVDASHKLWVWLFDTPNIGPGSMPIDQILRRCRVRRVGLDDGRCTASHRHAARHLRHGSRRALGDIARQQGSCCAHVR